MTSGSGSFLGSIFEFSACTQTGVSFWRCCLLADLTTNITRVIRIPLSVDIESGYTSDPDEVGENIKPILDAGAVGINIEDGEGSPDLLVAKIENIRRTASHLGIDLFINACTDVYLRELVAEERRVDETIARAARYCSAGADGIFIPGLIPETEAKSSR